MAEPSVQSAKLPAIFLCPGCDDIRPPKEGVQLRGGVLLPDEGKDGPAETSDSFWCQELWCPRCSRKWSLVMFTGGFLESGPGLRMLLRLAATGKVSMTKKDAERFRKTIEEAEKR